LLGERLHAAAPAGHWQTSTMLSAIRVTGVIESATLIFEGATDATIFGGYVQQCLAPSLRRGDIVVMDNLSSHKVAGVREAIEAMGAELWYLPPYSPDLNPIEKLWSKIKTLMRRSAARTFDSLVQAMASALRAVAPDECRNYFRSCGYATDDREML
jgi:transposase